MVVVGQDSVLVKLAKRHGPCLVGANHTVRVVLRMLRVSVALGVVDAGLAKVPLAPTNGDGLGRFGRLDDQGCSAAPATGCRRRRRRAGAQKAG